MDKKVIAFWLGVLVLLSLLLGRSWDNPLGGFFMVTCMMPIIMGITYVISSFLIPRFLEAGHTGKFILYLAYVFIISLYLQLWVIIGAFMYLANFDFRALSPSVQDLVQLSSTTYLIAGLAVFVLQALSSSDSVHPSTVEDELIELISNRKNIEIKASLIIYIESLNGRTYFHLKEGEPLETREKLGVLSEKLPNDFVRVHRSFIVNAKHVEKKEAEKILMMSKEEIPFGRAYKKAAIQRL
jgi:hypothetical protein